MKGRKTTKKSKQIIKLIERKIPLRRIAKMGYPIMTVQYYSRKLNKPEKFKEMVDKIKALNKRRYKAKKAKNFTNC